MTQHDMYVGTQIGNYRVKSLLASGGFGSVYLAKHTILSERTVAFKVLHAVYLNATDERESFLLEAQLLEKLKHPNILPILDVGISANNTPYIIAEYAVHGSLRENIKAQAGRPLPFTEAMRIVTQVAEALQHAHQQNIIHRDLKPENILFDAQNKVLLADFGIATALIGGTSKVDRIAGTPLYMAPEQFKGVVSRGSDQYSLACIAYELLTGRPPFESADFVAMAYQHTNELPKPPRQLNPALPTHVEQALLKALAKDRHARYPSVAAFISALQSPTTRSDVVPPPPPPQSERKQERAAVIPPPPPQAQQPVHRSPQQPPVYMPPPQAQQAYRQTPPVQLPPYNYMAPQQMIAAMEPTGGDRLVAALSYIAPYFVFFYIIGWPIAAVGMYFLSRDKPFLRFHFLQAQLLFLAYVVVLFLVYGIASGSGVQSVNTAIGVVVVAYLILTVLYLIFAAMGRRTRVPLIGGFASRYADRRK